MTLVVVGLCFIIDANKLAKSLKERGTKLPKFRPRQPAASASRHPARVQNQLDLRNTPVMLNAIRYETIGEFNVDSKAIVRLTAGFTPTTFSPVYNWLFVLQGARL